MTNFGAQVRWSLCDRAWCCDASDSIVWVSLVFCDTHMLLRLRVGAMPFHSVSALAADVVIDLIVFRSKASSNLCLSVSACLYTVCTNVNMIEYEYQNHVTANANTNMGACVFAYLWIYLIHLFIHLCVCACVCLHLA